MTELTFDMRCVCVCIYIYILYIIFFVYIVYTSIFQRMLFEPEGMVYRHPLPSHSAPLGRSACFGCHWSIDCWVVLFLWESVYQSVSYALNLTWLARKSRSHNHLPFCGALQAITPLLEGRYNPHIIYPFYFQPFPHVTSIQ